MQQSRRYIIQSLELHLFFARIMKEHSLFLKAGFSPADKSFAEEAEFYRCEFEKLLNCAVELSDGVVGCDVLDSCEISTEFTLCAEAATERFTGIPICREITELEQRLCGRNDDNLHFDNRLSGQVRRINQTALNLVNGLIELKERILQRVVNCQMFTMNYPLLIEHIIREAKLYRSYIRALETNGRLNRETQRQTEQFWNRIMMEHALFIRGLLDPSECELIDKADSFACDFKRLMQNCRCANDRTIDESLCCTQKFRDFKTAGVQGITGCSIKSIILPLLADHVLREANHYIRLLS